MAHSTMDISTAQHYITCEFCNKNAEFYCHSCHNNLCHKCKEEHLLTDSTRQHQVVLYSQKEDRSGIPETCKNHPNQTYIMCCQTCQAPVCTKCIAEKHPGHILVETDVMLKSKLDQVDPIILKIKDEILPKCYEILNGIKAEVPQCKDDILRIRSIMKSKADILKNLVDEIVNENMEFLDDVENSLTTEMQSQEKAMNNHIDYLQNIVDEYQRQKQKPAEFISDYQENSLSSIKDIPEIISPTFPSFEEGQTDKDVISMQFGYIKESEEKSRKGEILSRNKSFPSMKLDSNVSMVKTIPVPSFDRLSRSRQISCLKSGRAWVSNSGGNLVLIDDNGSEIRRMKIGIGFGNHAANDANELLYTDQDGESINKIKPDDSIQTFIKPGGWKPISICVSKFNGEILVGLKIDEQAKVTRYSPEGRELQQIQFNEKCQPLYHEPRYITNNINGDICVSDEMKRKFYVLVVDSKGKECFYYTGQVGTPFEPSGICTDILGHILVYNHGNNSVYMLDVDGTFLSVLLNLSGFKVSKSLCVDDSHRLCIAHGYRVSIFKYLQEED